MMIQCTRREYSLQCHFTNLKNGSFLYVEYKETVTNWRSSSESDKGIEPFLSY